MLLVAIDVYKVCQKSGVSPFKPLPKKVGTATQLESHFQIGAIFGTFREDAVRILTWSACRRLPPYIARRPGLISVVMDIAALRISSGGGCADWETQK
jgi:hypothetical protein